MRTSTFVGGTAALAAGAFVYYLTTRRGHAFRSSVQERASASAQWLRTHQQDLNPGFDRLEQQITALGDEMRVRLDDIRRQAAGAVQPPIDLGDWSLEKEDVQEDLRGLPRRG